MSRGKSHKMAVSSALRSARLPVNLIGSPISYANRLIGSPITSQSTGCVDMQAGCQPPQSCTRLESFRGSGVWPGVWTASRGSIFWRRE